MKFLILAAFIGLASAFTIDQEWETFKVHHFKEYATDNEHSFRKEVFSNNLAYIKKHNFEAEAGKHTYVLGVNEFSDMTHAEFLHYFTSMAHVVPVNKTVKSKSAIAADLPDTVDWVKKGYVTPVKNQGQCGSCWSFSATGAMEGAHFKKTGKLVSLSEKNLVDCDKKSQGCNGGWMDYAFDYVIKNGGIDTEESYPYKPEGGDCQFKKENIGTTISSYKDIDQSEDALKEAIATVGPIAIGMDAGHVSFQHYKTGIYNETDCSTTFLDHGVLGVGYGTIGNGDYWLIKNSWGTTWGMDGYFMIARNKNNMCGVATSSSYPIA